MKTLLLLSTLIALGYAQQQPQPRPGAQCPCPDVICPNNGRDACECMNRAAQDCFRSWELRRNPYCIRPTPLVCQLSFAESIANQRRIVMEEDLVRQLS
jgi:hypothetical protein